VYATTLSWGSAASIPSTLINLISDPSGLENHVFQSSHAYPEAPSCCIMSAICAEPGDSRADRAHAKHASVPLRIPPHANGHVGSSHHAGVASAASEDTVAERPAAAKHPDVALAVAEHTGIALAASANAVTAPPFADETASATASDPSEGMKIPGARNGRPDQQHDAVGISLQLVGPEVCVRGDQLRLSLGLVEVFKFEITSSLSFAWRRQYRCPAPDSRDACPAPDRRIVSPHQSAASTA
jgi:hypothetical protein